MIDLAIQEVATFKAFVREWHADHHADSDAHGDSEIATDTTRLFWQLLGQLDADEVLIRIPSWLADAKAGFSEGPPPTEVVGRIERETEEAILLGDAWAARPLMKLAHRIHELEKTEGDPDRNEWLDRRLDEHRRTFARREEVPELAERWLPKSQLEIVIRRRE